MSETSPTPSESLCANCPRRAWLARVAARAVGVRPPIACEGPVIVQRGRLVSQVRKPGEPRPEGGWPYVSSNIDVGGDVYRRIDWQTRKECGRDAVPRDDEVSYAVRSDGGYWKNDGQRYAAFLGGDPEEVAAQLEVLRNGSLLDYEDYSDDDY